MNFTSIPKPYTIKNVVMVLFSGGLDSTVICADLLWKGYEVVPIVFDDGTPNFNNRRAGPIKAVLKELNLLSNLIVARSPDYSACNISEDVFGFEPGRKMTFITIALSYMQMLNISELRAGYCKENSNHGFQDEENEYQDLIIDTFWKTYGNEPNNTSNGSWNKPVMVNPFRDMEKCEVIDWGDKLHAPMFKTTSCGDASQTGSVHCGQCVPCARRKHGFELASIEDKTLYLNNDHWSDLGHDEKLIAGYLHT